MKTRNILIAIAILLSVISLLLSFGSVFYAGDHIKDTDTIEDTKPDPDDQTDVPGDTTPAESESTNYLVNVDFFKGDHNYYYGFIDYNNGNFINERFTTFFENITVLYVWCDSYGSTNIDSYMSYSIVSGNDNVKVEHIYEYDDLPKILKFEFSGPCSITLGAYS